MNLDFIFFIHLCTMWQKMIHTVYNEYIFIFEFSIPSKRKTSLKKTPHNSLVSDLDLFRVSLTKMSENLTNQPTM